MKKTCALLALALLAGCGDEPQKVAPVEAPPPPAPKEVRKAPPPPMPTLAPPLTDAQNAAIAKAFAEARGYAKDAEAARVEAQRIEKSQSREAANDTYVKARDLYRKAAETVSEWTDGDLGGKITDAQLRDYLSNYVNEVGRWQKAVSDIGKVHR